MKKMLFILAMINFANADDWSCSRETTYDDGWSKYLEVSLTLTDDEIKSVYIVSSISNGEEGGGSACFFDSNEFIDNDIGYRIEDGYHIYESPDSKSELKLDLSGDSLRLSTDISRDFCGFSAEIPNIIVISKSNSVCSTP